MINIKDTKDKYVNTVISLFSECELDDYSTITFEELIKELGRMGNRFNERSYTKRQRVLCIKTLYLEFCGVVNKLQGDYEYHIKYGGAGENLLAYSEVKELLDTSSDKNVYLYRISDKDYNRQYLTGTNSSDIISKYATLCAKHINTGTGEDYRTNSYSKMLGVALFKYLGDCNESGKFILKIVKTKLNSLTLDSDKVVSIESLKSDRRDDITEVKNIVLDASSFKNNADMWNPTTRVRNNTEWGYSVNNAPLVPAVNPEWDNEVLVLNDKACGDSNYAEVELSITDVIELLIKYYCIWESIGLSIDGETTGAKDCIESYNLISNHIELEEVKEFVIDHVKTHGYHGYHGYMECSAKKELMEFISNVKPIPDSKEKTEPTDTILSTMTSGWTDYLKKGAWGETELHKSLSMVRDALVAHKGGKRI